MLLMLFLLLTAGATSNADAKPLAAYLELSCALDGALVPCTVVPDTQLDKCEGYKADLADERALLEASVVEARGYRTKMEQCGGKLSAVLNDLGPERARRISLEVENGLLKNAAAARWSALTWFGIGGTTGAVIAVVLTVLVLK